MPYMGDIMPTNTSKKIIAFGADHIVKLATTVDNWRDFVAFLLLNKEINALLSAWDRLPMHDFFFKYNRGKLVL
jgi:hypothetical protein